MHFDVTTPEAEGNALSNLEILLQGPYSEILAP